LLWKERRKGGEGEEERRRGGKEERGRGGGEKERGRTERRRGGGGRGGEEEEEEGRRGERRREERKRGGGERDEANTASNFIFSSAAGVYTLSFRIPEKSGKEMIQHVRFTPEQREGQDILTFINKKKWYPLFYFFFILFFSEFTLRAFSGDSRNTKKKEEFFHFREPRAF
jgi:hypothetical protein